MNLEFDIVALLLYLVIYVYMSIRYTHEIHSNRVFRGLLLCGFFMTVFDIFSSLLIYRLSAPNWLNVLASEGYYFFIGAAVFMFVMYVRSHAVHRGNHWWNWLVVYLPIVLYLILVLTNFKTQLLFYFDESGAYIHGHVTIGEHTVYTYYLGTFVPFYYFIFAFVEMAIYHRDFTVKQMISTATYVLVEILFTSIQVFIFPTSMLSCFGSAIAIIAMMITMETPDYQRLIRVRAQLEEARAEAQAANAAKSEFLANMSHEIRTPINGVLGMDRIILKNPTISDEVREYAEGIEQSGKSLLTIVNDILDLSKIESGKMEIVPVEYHLMDVMNSLYQTASLMAREKGIQFIMENNPSIPDTLIGDEVRVRQIAYNLINNAIKYTESGSVMVYFGSRKLNDRELMLTAFFQDTGKGITEAEAVGLFDHPEHPVTPDGDGDPNAESTRLSLRITQQLITLMGGTMEVDSEPGRGTNIRVEIPQSIGTEAEPKGHFVYREMTESEENRPLYAPGARILVVDDVAMNLKVFFGLLKDTGIRIDKAMSGPEAIELIRKEQYNVIFLDHMMPGMDGVETLHKIREDDSHKNTDTPVIVLTANAITGAKEEYLAEGFADYLSKPVQEHKLKKMLSEYIPTTLKEEPKEPEPEKKTVAQAFAFLDIRSAMDGMGGNEELYVQMLRSSLAERRDEMLEVYFERRDWEAYRDNVHALRGLYLSLGASAFAEQAKAVEKAVRDGDYETVYERHPAMMTEYLELLEKIGQGLSEI